MIVCPNKKKKKKKLCSPETHSCLEPPEIQTTVFPLNRGRPFPKVGRDRSGSKTQIATWVTLTTCRINLFILWLIKFKKRSPRVVMDLPIWRYWELLDKGLSNLVQLEWLQPGSWLRRPSDVPFNLNYSVILGIYRLTNS